MNVTDLDTLPLLGLLALVPVAAFLLSRRAYIVVLSVVCVLLIVGSLLVIFRRDEDGKSHATAGR